LHRVRAHAIPSTPPDRHSRTKRPTRRLWGCAVTRTQRWVLVAALLVGMTAGLGLFTFGYARGYSYLTNDPRACANCHIMSEHYAAWTKASHHAVATCNDCHTPHDLIGKYTVKAKNGFWHSFYFTTGGYPDPLRITEGNHRVTENACRYCHAEITDAIDHGAGTVSHAARAGSTSPAGEPISCIRCHTYVGHWVR
jgi:cytochrome c nitrite reductase small subunit